MGKDKRLVIVVSTYPPEHCGVGRDAFQLVRSLNKLRDVRVLANVVNGAPLEEGGVSRVWRKHDLAYPFKIVSRIRRVRERTDAIVHVYHHFNLYGGPASAPSFLLLLMLLRMRGYSVVVQPQSVIDPREVPELARSYGRAIPPSLVRLGLRWFYRSMAILAARTAVCTASMRSILVRQYGVDPRRIWVVPVGWQEVESVSRSALEEVTTEPGAPRLVMFHGFLDPTKGLADLLEGFAREHAVDPRSRLVFAGETSPHLGPSGEAFVRSLKERVDQLGLRHAVTFTGYLDEAGLTRMLSSADVFVLPYTMVASHGGSASLSRVAGFGKPLIASRISRFADEIVDGETGLLVDPGRPDEIQAALHRVFTDTALADRLGHNLRKLAEQRTWKASAELLDGSLYPSLGRGQVT